MVAMDAEGMKGQPTTMKLEMLASQFDVSSHAVFTFLTPSCNPFVPFKCMLCVCVCIHLSFHTQHLDLRT